MLEQTTEAMKAKIKEASNWNTVNDASGCIGLLKIIKKSAHNTEDQKNPTLSLIEAMQHIYSLQQQDSPTPEAYKVQLDNMMDIITSMNGYIYQPPMLEMISKKLTINLLKA